VLCCGMGFLLYSVTALDPAFPTRSAGTLSEVYPDESAAVIRANANIHI
jgi:hypothetical protein